jgi:hypothetical protein
MRTSWDNGVWSELAEHEPCQLQPLVELVEQHRIKVLLNPTTLAEMHGIGPGHPLIYAARNRTVRSLGMNRLLTDAKELVTDAFVRYAAALLGGTFAQDASQIRVRLLSREFLSRLPPFSHNAPLKDYLDAAKARNRAHVSRLRQECVTDTDGALTRRIALFRQAVQTSGATAVLSLLDRLPAGQKVCPFILSIRTGVADLETQIAASDTLMLHQMVSDVRALPSLPNEPWDNASSNLLKRHASLFTVDFWQGLHRVNDDSYLLRQRTYSWIAHYLMANGFARDDGSFLFDAQSAVYMHDVDLFVTTDARVCRGLETEYMTQHLRRFGRSPRIACLTPSPDLPDQLVELLTSLT